MALLMVVVGAVGTAQAQTTTVTASWDRNTDANTAGYMVHYGTSSGNYQWSHDAGNAVSAQLTLSQGAVYYFAVRAYNSSAELGPASTEATFNLSTAPAAPTAQITATLQGTNALVTWSTGNATSATINGTAVGLSGSTTVPVTATTTFTIIATNSAGATASSSATVTVTAAPAPTASISATLQGTNAVVTWQSANASTVRINGVSVAASGTQTVPVTATTTFTLVASNTAGQSVTRTATVTVTAPAAPTASLTATLQNGNAALLTWTSANATSVTINGTSVATSGSQSIPVSATTTFTLVARNAAGQSVTRTATVTVTAPAAPTASFTATLQNGNAALLTWTSANATSVTINGASVATSGSQSIPVSATTTFTLVARNAAGQTVTRTATVTVAPVAAPTASFTASLQNGNTALLTWTTANATAVTINGNAVSVSGTQTVPLSAPTTFTLVARNAAGASTTRVATLSPTPTQTPTGLPGAPVRMTATVNGSRVTFSWAAPTNGGTPERYLIDLGLQGAEQLLVSAYNVGNVFTVSADLQKGNYNVRVRAQNASGYGMFSNVFPFTVGRRLATPTRFTVQWVGGTATLSWVAPAADGGVENIPTSYVLEAGTSPGARDVATVNVGNVTRFSAPVGGGTYYVRVRAENAFGYSEPTADIALVAPGAPGAPSTLVASRSSSVVALRWNAPNGPTPSGYLLEAGSAPGLADLAVVQLGPATTFSTAAPPAGTYYLRVRAVNERGAGLPSNEFVIR